MHLKDFEIDSTNKLDKILLNCCQLVINAQINDSEYYGMVGACVVDNENRKVYGINHLMKNGTRTHAERAAINNYAKKYGKLPKDSLIVTTLSPCSSDMDERYGSSCTQLINDSDIYKVYCGYKDPNEQDDEAYKHRHFHVAETRNKKLRELCKKMADTFLVKPKIVSELDKSKTYRKPIGMMEMYKFMQIATEEQKLALKKLIHDGKQEEAWKLLQQVTGSKL